MNPNAELAESEKRHIRSALAAGRGDRAQTSKKLDVSVRTLRNKRVEYGVSSKDDGESDEAANA